MMNKLSVKAKWEEIYNFFKGPDWPICPLEKDFVQLPDWVQKELIDFGYIPIGNQQPQEIKQFICEGTKPIVVFFTSETDGGGSTFGQDYISVIKQKYPGRKFPKVFEWCSGPGFIGFSILSHGLCDSLCFNDLYNPAIELIDMTVQHPENECIGLVSSYLLKDIGLLPKHERFDLVVSNPPHYNSNVCRLVNSNRLSSDIDWKSHQNFFSNIKKYLNPNGIILLQESMDGSKPENFFPFINSAGLEIISCIENSQLGIYYLELKSLDSRQLEIYS